MIDFFVSSTDHFNIIALDHMKNLKNVAFVGRAPCGLLHQAPSVKQEQLICRYSGVDCRCIPCGEVHS